jgi:TldD protein
MSIFKINIDKIKNIVTDSLHGLDDGELYLEYSQSEGLVFEDNILRSSNFNTSQGFGMRAVAGDAIGYAHSSDINEVEIQKAAQIVRAIKTEESVVKKLILPIENKQLYMPINPIDAADFSDKLKLLEKINDYVRSKDERVMQVSISIVGQLKNIQIITIEGKVLSDIRPLMRLNISVTAQENNRIENGSSGGGGRDNAAIYLDDKYWQHHADTALQRAITNLSSVQAKAGKMDVVLAPGWPGIILHEAVGHSLEGDCNRKKTSVFSDMIGQKIAAEDVTVIDNGQIENRRGSLNIDDEGTPTSSTTLIENGVLIGYMHDRLSARIMGHKATGNGRREDYKHPPLPRMTNTYMVNGKQDPQEIISSVKDGIYCVSFGGGQVDTTSGKFVFSASEAYKIINGKICQPVKGATLIGSGSESLKNISSIGNDMTLDDGIGTCGKQGQSVPVGVGQPTIKITNLTVGGTEV